MKKFRFSLETVLSYKQQILDALQIEHASIQQNIRMQEEHLADCWNRYRAYNEEYRRRSSEGIALIDALVYENGLRGMEEVIQQEAERLEQLRKQEEKKRAEVLTARTETVSIEKLKEKKLEEYQKELTKADEAFVEEFVSSTRTRAANQGDATA